MDELVSPCEGACVVGAPECGQPDCEQRGFYGYVAVGSTVEGIYAYSPGAATVSSVGPIVRRVWAIEGSGVRLDPPNKVFVKTCYADRLEGDYVKQPRANDAIRAAIVQASAGGATSFHAAPVAK